MALTGSFTAVGGSNILGAKVAVPDLSGQATTMSAIDLVYRQSAVILDDVVTILGGAFNVPVPLVGFQYADPESLEILNYDYATYNYLNRTQITNSYIKKNGSASILAIKPLGSLLNPTIMTHVGLNEALYYTLEAYCDKGGTFTLMTLWGAYNNFVLKSLKAEKTDNALGGTGWRMDFEKINTASSKLEQQISESLSSLSRGTV